MRKKQLGNKSKYETHVLPNLDKIEEAIKQGASVANIADSLGVNRSTFYKYLDEHTELKDTFARARAGVVIEVKSALLKRARGYTATDEKSIAYFDKEGDRVVRVETTTREVAPDVSAINAVLYNFDDEWHREDTRTLSFKEQEQALKEAIAECNNFDLDLRKDDKNEVR